MLWSACLQAETSEGTVMSTEELLKLAIELRWPLTFIASSVFLTTLGIVFILRGHVREIIWKDIFKVRFGHGSTDCTEHVLQQSTEDQEHQKDVDSVPSRVTNPIAENQPLGQLSPPATRLPQEVRAPQGPPEVEVGRRSSRG